MWCDPHMSPTPKKKLCFLVELVFQEVCGLAGMKSVM